MKIIEYKALNSFRLMINHSVLNKKTHIYEIDSHIHDECEIYINLTGDVSFMVENRLYPVSRGDAIITRPYEYHHCVYNSDSPQHELFWILFSSSGNEDILDIFFKRNYGEGNLITLSPDKREELIELCLEMSDKELTEAEKYLYFFRLITILTGDRQENESSVKMPPDMAFAISYLENNLTENLTVKELAEAAHVSVNTIERRFREFFNITPTEFIRRKRLIKAAELLRGGSTVLEAGMECGFGDNSYFIRLFRETYGMTPLQYRKSCEGKK